MRNAPPRRLGPSPSAIPDRLGLSLANGDEELVAGFYTGCGGLGIFCTGNCYRPDVFNCRTGRGVELRLR